MTQDHKVETRNVDMLDVNTLPDQTLTELLELYEQKIEAGQADFEEFNAFILCQHERNRRRKAANQVGAA
ncbi:hypothetical protein BH24DEI2_BH24DEI2_08340 [soil metagenome]